MDKVVLTDAERASAEIAEVGEGSQSPKPEPRFLLDARIEVDAMGRLKIEARQYDVIKVDGKNAGMKHVFDLDVVLGPHPDAAKNVVEGLRILLENAKARLQPNAITPAGADALRALENAKRQTGNPSWAKRLKNDEAVKEVGRVLQKLTRDHGWKFSASLYRERDGKLQITQLTNILPMHSREIAKKLTTPGVEIEAKTFLVDGDGDVHSFVVAGAEDKIREDAERLTRKPEPQRVIEIEKPRVVYRPGEGWR